MSSMALPGPAPSAMRLVQPKPGARPSEVFEYSGDERPTFVSEATPESSVELVRPLTDDALHLEEPRPAQQDDPRLGTVVGGYRLLERVGLGGWASVYRAKHEIMGREVAIKLLTPRGKGRYRRQADVEGGAASSAARS